MLIYQEIIIWLAGGNVNHFTTGTELKPENINNFIRSSKWTKLTCYRIDKYRMKTIWQIPGSTVL